MKKNVTSPAEPMYVRGGLLCNEFIKIRRQTGLFVMLIIVLAISLTMPLWLALVRTVTTRPELSIGEMQDNYISMSRDCLERAGEESSPAMAELMLIDAEYYYVCADALTLFADGTLPRWKLDCYLETYTTAVLKRHAAELIDSGKYSLEQLLDSSFYTAMCTKQTFSSAVCDYVDGRAGLFRITDDGSYVDIDSATFLTLAGVELDSVTAFVRNTDFSGYLVSFINDLRAELNSADAAVGEYEKLLETRPGDTELISSRDGARLLVEGTSALLEAYEWMYKNCTEYSGWRLRTVNEGMADAASTLAECTVIDRATYESGWFDRTYASYDNYVTMTENTAAAARRALKAYRHSLESGIPDSKMSDTPVKQTVQRCISLSSGIMTALGVVLAAVSVANEFSSGSIRLLLIHPRKRRKILFSKLGSVALTLTGVYFASVIGQTALNILLFGGVGDLLSPDLYYIGGQAVYLPSVLRILETLAYELLPALFLTTAALLFSCLTVRSVLSIVLSGALRLVLGIFYSIVPLSPRVLTRIAAWTVLPYHDGMSAFVHDPTLIESASALPGLCAAAGVTALVLWTVLLAAAAQLCFGKRQVKS